MCSPSKRTSPTCDEHLETTFIDKASWRVMPRKILMGLATRKILLLCRCAGTCHRPRLPQNRYGPIRRLGRDRNDLMLPTDMRPRSSSEVSITARGRVID